MAIFQVVKEVSQTIVYQVEADSADDIYDGRAEWEVPENIVDSESHLSQIVDVVQVDDEVDE